MTIKTFTEFVKFSFARSKSRSGLLNSHKYSYKNFMDSKSCNDNYLDNYFFIKKCERMKQIIIENMYFQF